MEHQEQPDSRCDGLDGHQWSIRSNRTRRCDGRDRYQWNDRGPLDLPVPRDLRDQLGCRALPDLKDKPDPKAKKAPRVTQDQLDRKAKQAQWGPQAPGPPVRPDLGTDRTHRRHRVTAPPGRGPGPEGSSAYAEFYALMPPDNAATVAAGTPVDSPATVPRWALITRLTPAEFVLPSIGTYSVSFSVSVTEPGQLVIALDSGGVTAELPYTAYGRATGTSQISGDALVSTTVANSTIELRNPKGNTPALTITPLAGGTQPAAASIVIQQVG